MTCLPFSWSISTYSNPQLILIIGEPPINDLIPLLTSLHLSSSLVLIATHTPPLIPVNTRGPAIRILRLSQPLAVHESGALRLVNLLERAQRAVHLWPRDSSQHIIQLAQSSQNSDFSIVEPVSYLPGTTKLSPYPSPAPSTSEHGAHPKSTSTPSPHKKLHRTRPSLKNLDDKLDYKPFDAIINFIPYGLPDKAILKHAILLTTITAQFIAPPTCISPITNSQKNSHRQSQNSIPFSPISSSNSHSSTSQRTSSPSGSTPVTSPCPSPPPMTSSKTKDSSLAPTQISKVKNRFSLLFRTASPSPPSLLPPRYDFRPLPEVFYLNDGSWKMKNAHLVHVLPVGWTPDSGTESDRRDRRASSSNLIPRGPNRHPHSAGYSNGTGRHCRPKLVQSIEQFLLSFAYPLGNIVSGNFGSGLRPGTSLSSPSSHASIRNKTARILSSTSIINEDSITPVSPRPVSSPGLKNRTRAYEQENYLIRASTLSTPLSTSNRTFSSNIDTPLKPAPYLLASGIFGRCAHGSNRSRVRSGRSSSPAECGVGEDGSEQNHGEDTQSDTYTDPEATALSIGEIILLGALDFDHMRPGAGPGNGRAWIGNVSDVVFVDENPGQGSNLKKAGVREAKGRELVTTNTEMTKTRNVNVALQTPPESLSSNNSADGVEEQVEGMSSVGHTRIDDRHILPALSTRSSPSRLDDIRNLHRHQARTPSGSRSGKKVGFDDEALVVSPTLTTSTATKPNATDARHVLSTSTSNSLPLPKSMPISRPTSNPATTPSGGNSTPNTKSKLSKQRKSSLSTRTPTPALSIPSPKQTHAVKDKGNSLSSLSSLPPSAVQVPPLVVHRDRTRSPRRSGDNHDLGLPVPLTISMKSDSRSASGSGSGSGMERGWKTRSMHGEMRSPVDLVEGSGKGLERKGFVGALKKLGLWV